MAPSFPTVSGACSQMPPETRSPAICVLGVARLLYLDAQAGRERLGLKLLCAWRGQAALIDLVSARIFLPALHGLGAAPRHAAAGTTVPSSLAVPSSGSRKGSSCI